MLEVFRTSQFRRDFKKIQKSGSFDVELFDRILLDLRINKVLDMKYRDHALSGNLRGLRECHIKPDLLLVYRKNNDKLILVLVRIGSHSELF